MGDIADSHVISFTTGRWGIPLPPQRAYPKTTREAIRDGLFSVVEVVGGRTNRIAGMKLVVCDQDAETYWVWASSGVTGIAKAVCKVLEPDMPLEQALAKRAFLALPLRKQMRVLKRQAAIAIPAAQFNFNDDI